MVPPVATMSPVGLLKRASEGLPSANPLCPLPATVETVPSGSTRRMAMIVLVRHIQAPIGVRLNVVGLVELGFVAYAIGKARAAVAGERRHLFGLEVDRANGVIEIIGDIERFLVRAERDAVGLVELR